MEISVRQTKKNTDEVWKAKQALLDLPIIRAGKDKDGNYLFRIEDADDLNEQDWRDIIQLGIKAIMPEDLERIRRMPPLPAFFQEIAGKLSFEHLCDSYTIKGDVCSVSEVSEENTLFELTADVSARNRLACLVRTSLARMLHLHEDMRVELKGSLGIYAPSARLEFMATEMSCPKDERTAFDAFYEEQEHDLNAFDKDEAKKRRQRRIKASIGKWKKLAVIAPNAQTIEEFDGILGSRDIGLKLLPYIRKFEPENLETAIHDIDEKSPADAVLILHRTVSTRYVLWGCSEYDFCMACHDLPLPLLMALGAKPSLQPLCCRYADYRTETIGQMANRLQRWIVGARIEKEKATPKQVPLMSGKQEQAVPKSEAQEGEQESFLHRLLPWL